MPKAWRSVLKSCAVEELANLRHAWRVLSLKPLHFIVGPGLLFFLPFRSWWNPGNRVPQNDAPTSGSPSKAQTWKAPEPKDTSGAASQTIPRRVAEDAMVAEERVMKESMLYIPVVVTGRRLSREYTSGRFEHVSNTNVEVAHHLA